MIETAQNEVTAAIATALAPGRAIDAQLQALSVVGVYDFRGVPQNATFDYITIGQAQESSLNTFGRRGYMLAPTIHIWSRQGGIQQGTNILARINQLINQQDLPLASQSLVYLIYERALWVADPDGLTLHIAAQYRIYTEE
jgi:hypothetical protein